MGVDSAACAGVQSIPCDGRTCVRIPTEVGAGGLGISWGKRCESDAEGKKESDMGNLNNMVIIAIGMPSPYRPDSGLPFGSV